MKYYFIQLLNSLMSIPFIIQLGAIIVAVLSPYYTLSTLVIGFWFIDLLTGIWNSTKLKFLEKKPVGFISKLKTFWSNFQSRKLRWSIEKLACYLIVIMLMAFFEFYFMPFDIAGYTLTKVACGFLALVEIKSIFENLSLITKNQIFIKLFSLFSTKFKDKTGIDINDEKNS